MDLRHTLGAEQTGVLLIEDDARAAAGIEQAIRAGLGSGTTISHARRLSDAEDVLCDRNTACVLVDSIRQHGGPLVAIGQIRRLTPDVAIVVLGAQRDDELAVAALNLGAQDYLVWSELQPAQLGRAVHFAIERKRCERRLVSQALHDPLTGLPNRTLFLDRLRMALDRSRRTNATVAVMFLDVDDFKTVNDTLGHRAGDSVLAGLAAELRTMLRPMDTISRHGGDEFTVLVEDLSGQNEAVLIAERIDRAAQTPTRLADRAVSITVSIGITLVTDPTLAPDIVIAQADSAMYRAKSLGPGRHEVFVGADRDRGVQRGKLERELRDAVDRAELCVHYQPNVSLGGKRDVIGFEALVRWQHPERGLMTSEDFIPLAEETGIVQRIDEFVLDDVMHQIVRWRELKPDLTVSVNVSGRRLEDASLPSNLTHALEATGMDPDALCLEVHETTLASRPDATVRALRGLKSTGVRLAIDNYGIGPSSLSSFERLPADTLKIHRSVACDPAQPSLIGAMVEFGHALGCTVLAEGVETDDQLTQVRDAGCDGAQGFLFGPAVSRAEAEALLVAG